jgi:hypothetical protein
MTTLADLHRSVQTTLASKRLGTPVFVRYLYTGQEKTSAVLPRLAQIVDVVRAWINQVLERIYAIGTVKEGQVALTLEFRGGATALVSWAAGTPRGAGADLMVLGNHGALYHDAGSTNLWDEPARPPAMEVDKTLLDWVERAVRTGRPEAAGKGGGR